MTNEPSFFDPKYFLHDGAAFQAVERRRVTEHIARVFDSVERCAKALQIGEADAREGIAIDLQVALDELRERVGDDLELRRLLVRGDRILARIDRALAS